MKLLSSGVLTRLIDRLTYANVAATLALFISLGGASYAAITLPAGSVGSKQLRNGAVLPRNLGFAFTTSGTTDEKVEIIHGEACGGDLRPGEPLNADCPHLKIKNIKTPGREVHLKLNAPAQLEISVVAGVSSFTAPAANTSLAFRLIVDGRATQARDFTLVAGQVTQVPSQWLITASRGSHSVGLGVVATFTPTGNMYAQTENDYVSLGPVSLVVTAFPSSR